MAEATQGLTRDDLRAAVAAGVLNERQAASLMSLSDARRGAREAVSPGDEPFELFKGFNEIFIVVGLVILTMGWLATAGLFVGTGLGGVVTRAVWVAAAGAAVLWLLSEYFVRRRRMVAPAITLAILFAANAAAGFVAVFAQPFMVAQEDYSSLPLPLALATGALLVYWLRFRVPFAMALIALGLFGTALVATAASAGSPESPTELFLLSADGPFAWVTLALGLAVFVAAMAFDMSDPHRVTRRASNGFWLHVVAAPALVNTIALSLMERGTPSATLLLMAFLGFIALVAVVIDRRSFLIAAVGYSVALASALSGGQGSAWTILALGIVLLALGAFWERIRAVLLRPLGAVLPLDRLPPAA